MMILLHVYNTNQQLAIHSEDISGAIRHQSEPCTIVVSKIDGAPVNVVETPEEIVRLSNAL